MSDLYSEEEDRIIGFTGTRNGLTPPQATALWDWMATYPQGALHHGDCVGADVSAHDAARHFGWWIEVHPGIGPARLRAFCSGYNALHPAKPNLERNTDIVASAEELVACPEGPETRRSGTWSTVRKARVKGIPRTIIWPDGSVTNDE